MDVKSLLKKRQNLVKRGKGQQLESKFMEVDKLLEETSDLINEEFRKWYCKRFFELGRERVTVLASQARADGNNSARLFSHLLRSN